LKTLTHCGPRPLAARLRGTENRKLHGCVSPEPFERPSYHAKEPVDLTQRFDFVFVHGSAQVLKSQEVGFGPRDFKPGDIWPSDHAAVVATVKF
jgi:hypothetical protein